MDQVSIRDLTASLDIRWPPRDPMDEAHRYGLEHVLQTVRAAEEDFEGNESPRGRMVRLYCTILRSLCEIRLTGASRQTAEQLQEAAHTATVEGNPELALLARWYAACCRLMWFFLHPPAHPNEVLGELIMQFSAISTAASRLHKHLWRAYAMAMAAYCISQLDEVHVNSADLAQRTDAALALLATANPGIQLVRECKRFLALIGSDTPRHEARPDLLAMLYTPGELRATVR